MGPSMSIDGVKAEDDPEADKIFRLQWGRR